MKRLSLLIAMLVFLVPASWAGMLHAQTVPEAQEGVGWTMVGAPSGTSFTGAEGLLAYANGGYSADTSGAAQTCQGYWAYFATAGKAVQLAPAPSTSSQTCVLQAGWNMVGNPFDTAATLPSGVTAYYWGGQGQYVTVQAIPVGGAVWIYAASPDTLTLTPAPRPAPALTITSISDVNAVTYQVHVGQTVALQPPGDLALVGLARADPHYFVLESYTSNPQRWVWLATAPGNAVISLVPGCALGPGIKCTLAFPPIQITVLP